MLRYVQRFSPICAVEQLGGARDGIDLVRICFDSNAAGIPDAQQVISNFKAFIMGGVVGAGDVHKGLELTVVMVAQKLEDGEEARGCNVEG